MSIANRSKVDGNAGTSQIQMVLTLDGPATGNETVIAKLSERFHVVLSNPQNLTIGDGTAQASIVNDDTGTTTRLFITEAATSEGNQGTKVLTFTITPDRAATSSVTVKASTADGTAKAGSDYVAITNQTVTFNPGQTSRTVKITVKGDHTVEPDERFTLRLTNPSGATLDTGCSTADGIIRNDD